MTVMPDEILAESSILFDDVRPGDVDPVKHASFVIARVLDRGTLKSVAALVRAYGIDRIRTFFRRGGLSSFPADAGPVEGLPWPQRGGMHLDIPSPAQTAVMEELTQLDVAIDF